MKTMKTSIGIINVYDREKMWSCKSRASANGSNQWQWIKKEDAMSPTIMGDSVMITLLIDAYERRKVIT